MDGGNRENLAESSQAQTDAEYEYVTVHEEYKLQVSGGTTVQPPKLTNQDTSNENVSDPAPSPLYRSENEDEVSQEAVNGTPPRKVILETPDDEEEEELTQRDNQTGVRGVVRGVVHDIVRGVVRISPPRTVILEESLRNTPVKQRLGMINRNQDDAQRTPPRGGELVFEEQSRRTPVKQRVGKTFTERKVAQRTLPVKERLGTCPSTSVFERLSDGPVAPEARRRRSRNARNSTSSRQSIPRRAKAEVPTRGQEKSKLDGTLEGCHFPIQEETTTDSDSETPEPKK